MSKSQRPNAIHIDMTKGVWLHAYKLPNEYAYYLPEELDYRLEINGHDFALTKSQFETMHDARIQVWDDGAKAERERIERLLPQILRIGNIDYLFDIEKEMPELVQEAKALIKGEQK